MKILSWNIRGLGNLRPFRALIQMLKNKDLDIVFIIKTKLSKNQLEFFHFKSKMTGCFRVDCVDLWGGLALLWKPNIQVSVKSFLSGHIGIVVDNSSKRSFRMTGFYGNPDASLRCFSWQLLEKIEIEYGLVHHWRFR